MSINITISGELKSGKSTIGFLIGKILTGYGFQVYLDEEHNSFEVPITDEDLTRRLEYCNGNRVDINYKITPRKR